LEFVNQRMSPNAMEPRCAIGHYDDALGKYTLWTTSQNPHLIRLLLCAFVLGLPEHKVRVVAPDVGGGFGSKIFHYTEEALVTWASNKIGRPVKWTSTRTEAFLTDAHGRDHITKAEMGFDANGNVVGLRVNTVANLGAYLSTFAPAVPTWLHGTLLQGLYTTPKIHIELLGVFTHTTAVDAYRGAGRPEATYLLERLMDKAALEMGKDPAALRLQNFIPPFDGVTQPGYQTQVALQYDSGNYHAVFGKRLGNGRIRRFPQGTGRGPHLRKIPRNRILDLHRGLRNSAFRNRRGIGCPCRFVRIGSGTHSANGTSIGVYRIALSWARA